jgi:N-carbamoylputrescine amidase
VVLVVPLFERQGPGVYRNSAAVIDADGSLMGVYRKMHIPDDPLFYEKYYFTPGDGGFMVWKTRYATIGVLICLLEVVSGSGRITSLMGAGAVYPHRQPSAGIRRRRPSGASHDAWRMAQRRTRFTSGVYVASPNRIGHEDEPGTDGITFFGHSFIADRSARPVAEGKRRGNGARGAVRPGAHRERAPQLALPA